MYSQTVLDHFGNPRNVGCPEGATVIGLVGDPSAGPFMRLFLQVDSGKIARAGFETYGCVASIASGSLLTEWLRGKSVDEAHGFSGRTLLKLLGGLPLGKEHCAFTAIEALAKALGSFAKSTSAQ